MRETLKCDRCGETYPLYKYNDFTDIEMDDLMEDNNV
jgi:hypothetical protein